MLRLMSYWTAEGIVHQMNHLYVDPRSYFVMKCSNLVLSVLLQFVIHNASQNALHDMPRLDIVTFCLPDPYDAFVLIPCSNAALHV